jgi:hypothetical protein
MFRGSQGAVSKTGGMGTEGMGVLQGLQPFHVQVAVAEALYVVSSTLFAVEDANAKFRSPRRLQSPQATYYRLDIF